MSNSRVSPVNVPCAVNTLSSERGFLASTVYARGSVYVGGSVYDVRGVYRL